MEIRWSHICLLSIFCHSMLVGVCIGDSNEEDSRRDETNSSDEANKVHSRQKRLIWVTNDGRLALPPGTALVITPSLGLPFVRYPPDGFFSNITISLPFTIDFDKLGLTDNENPYGVLPPIFARSMGRAAGSFLADYISQYLGNRRKKRSLNNYLEDTQTETKDIPVLPKEHAHAFHGGERALLYAAVEDMLTNFGMDGKACLLRAICEVHAHPLESFGLVGEMIRLFFTASKSPYSDYLDEYVQAENAGSGVSGSTECWPYHQACPRSLFRTKNKYAKDAEDHDEDLEIDNNNKKNKKYSEVTIDTSNDISTKSM